MHSKDYNIIDDAIDSFSEDTILRVFYHMCESRMFENVVVKVSNNRRINVKVHMSSGQEAVSAAVAEILSGYQIFTQHRSMDTYLALGGNPEELRDEMLCLDSGCCGGQIGGAFQIHNDSVSMFAHTGLIGENVSVGVGMALGNNEKTLCIFGDGAAEEDYVLEALGFAATHHLPVLFLCTDNELSVLSPKEKRRSWEITDIANGFGLKTMDIADDPFSLIRVFESFDEQLPALVNVRVCRNYWHAGVGVDDPPLWDRFIIVKEQLKERGLSEKADEMEQTIAARMEALWKDYL